jgi:hypothetical protein
MNIAIDGYGGEEGGGGGGGGGGALGGVPGRPLIEVLKPTPGSDGEALSEMLAQSLRPSSTSRNEQPTVLSGGELKPTIIRSDEEDD